MREQLALDDTPTQVEWNGWLTYAHTTSRETCFMWSHCLTSRFCQSYILLRRHHSCIPIVVSTAHESTRLWPQHHHQPHVRTKSIRANNTMCERDHPSKPLMCDRQVPCKLWRSPRPGGADPAADRYGRVSQAPHQRSPRHSLSRERQRVFVEFIFAV